MMIRDRIPFVVAALLFATVVTTLGFLWGSFELA